MHLTFARPHFSGSALLTLSLGALLFVSSSFLSSCTLIAEVDRTKIPDESEDGAGGGDGSGGMGGESSMAGSDSN